MNKLIDNEIIKTKEIIKNLHSYCFVSQPTYKKMGYKFRESDFDCLNNLVDESNRQKAEIERLNNELVSADEVIGFREAEIERLQEVTTNTVNSSIRFGLDKEQEIRKAKSEAYREFAERFNELLKDYAPYDTLHIYEIQDRIDIVEDILTEGGNEDGTNHS